MLRIILVRHGEVIGNKNKEYCGWIDHSLTKEGIKQAKDVALKLKDEKIDKIYVSDLSRTKETAMYINKFHKKKLIENQDFKEINFGIFEGKTYEKLQKDHKEELNLWQADWKNYRIPKGESLADMDNRVKKQINKIIKEDKGTVLIVSHSGVIRSILSHLIGQGIEDHWKYKVLNCTINSIEIVEGFPVLLYTNK